MKYLGRYEKNPIVEPAELLRQYLCFNTNLDSLSY